MCFPIRKSEKSTIVSARIRTILPTPLRAERLPVRDLAARRVARSSRVLIGAQRAVPAAAPAFETFLRICLAAEQKKKNRHARNPDAAQTSRCRWRSLLKKQSRV